MKGLTLLFFLLFCFSAKASLLPRKSPSFEGLAKESEEIYLARLVKKQLSEDNKKMEYLFEIDTSLKGKSPDLLSYTQDYTSEKIRPNEYDYNLHRNSYFWEWQASRTVSSSSERRYSFDIGESYLLFYNDGSLALSEKIVSSDDVFLGYVTSLLNGKEFGVTLDQYLQYFSAITIATLKSCDSDPFFEKKKDIFLSDNSIVWYKPFIEMKADYFYKEKSLGKKSADNIFSCEEGAEYVVFHSANFEKIHADCAPKVRGYTNIPIKIEGNRIAVDMLRSEILVDARKSVSLDYIIENTEQ